MAVSKTLLENMGYSELVALEKEIRKQKEKAKDRLYKSDLRFSWEEPLSKKLENEGYGKYSNIESGTYKAINTLRDSIIKIVDYTLNNYHPRETKRGIHREKNYVFPSGSGSVICSSDNKKYKEMVSDIDKIIMKYLKGE